MDTGFEICNELIYNLYITQRDGSRKYGEVELPILSCYGGGCRNMERFVMFKIISTKCGLI